MRSRAGGLEILIPAPCSILVVIFLSAWLVAWYFSERWVIQALLHVGESRSPLMLIFWSGGWTIAGLWTIVVWLWMFAGRQILKIASATLSLRSEVLGIGVTREYSLAGITNLRAVTTGDCSNWGWSIVPTGEDGVAFDYRSRTVHFATWLDETESSRIVDALTECLEGAA